MPVAYSVLPAELTKPPETVTVLFVTDNAWRAAFSNCPVKFKVELCKESAVLAVDRLSGRLIVLESFADNVPKLVFAPKLTVPPYAMTPDNVRFGSSVTTELSLPNTLSVPVLPVIFPFESSKSESAAISVPPVSAIMPVLLQFPDSNSGERPVPIVIVPSFVLDSPDPYQIQRNRPAHPDRPLVVHYPG